MESYYIWVSELKNVTYRAKRILAETFSDFDPESFSMEMLTEVGIGTNDAIEILRRTDLTEAKRIYALCGEKKIGLLPINDPRYPEQLQNIDDPPILLYWKGTLPDFDNLLNIAIVGSRGATAGGNTAAAYLGEGLSAVGVTVISGCAAGIDASAMKGALKRKGTVVGVLGCGADVIYPASNAALYREVAEKGCLLTEFPPGTKPDRWNFPKRNRIISGLSQGVVVVEAAAKSGSLITARYALEQGRDLFAYPGPAGSGYSAGTNALIKNGAYLTESFEDVLAKYSSAYEFVAEEPVEMPALSVETAPQAAEAPGRNEIRGTLPTGNDPVEAKILELLSEGPKAIDELVARTGFPAPRVISSVTMLRITAKVSAEPGGLYKVIYQ